MAVIQISRVPISDAISCCLVTSLRSLLDENRSKSEGLEDTIRCGKH